MNLSRRGFLAGIISACAAPAIVRSGLIMPIKPQLVVPPANELVVWPSSSGGLFTIVGEDSAGNAITEVLRLIDGQPMKTTKLFRTINGISAMAIGAPRPATPATETKITFGDSLILKSPVEHGKMLFYTPGNNYLGDGESKSPFIDESYQQTPRPLGWAMS